MNKELIILKGSRAEQHTTSLQCWKLASLSLLEIVLQLKDFQTRYGGDSAVVGQKRLAVAHQRSRHLDRIRWLEFERCSKVGRSLEEATIDFNKSQTSAVGQQRLITIGKRCIAGPIRYHQNFHQTEAGCHSHELAAIDRFKQRLHKRKKPLLFLYKVDKNLGIEPYRAGLSINPTRAVPCLHVWRRQLFSRRPFQAPGAPK